MTNRAEEPCSTHSISFCFFARSRGRSRRDAVGKAVDGFGSSSSTKASATPGSDAGIVSVTPGAAAGIVSVKVGDTAGGGIGDSNTSVLILRCSLPFAKFELGRPIGGGGA